jgi:hypothetical protein
MDKVFIQIEDVERDALLDDEGPPPHLGAGGGGVTAEGTAGLGALEGRLEFSTVKEEDEEEVRKEEAEMEVLMHPNGGGGREGTGMDLVSLNESSNNNNNNNRNNNKRLAVSFETRAAC